MADDEDALIKTYEPLCQVELDRIGITRADQMWIHAGTDGVTRSGYEAWLAELRGLPTGLGPVAYCAHLGFDYWEARRKLLPDVDGPE